MHVQTIISLTGTILCLCMASFQRLHRISCATCVIRKIELTLRNTIGVLDFHFNEKSENALYSLCNNQRLSAKLRERERETERERERGIHLP